MKSIPLSISDHAALLDAIAARRDIASLRPLHCRLIHLSLSSHRFLRSKLLAAYARCGRLDESHRIFSFYSLHCLPPLFSLNPLLSLLPRPFSLLRSMLSHGPFPNHISITSILKSPSVSSRSSLFLTKLLHSLSLSSGLLPSPLLFPSFISSYSSCGDLSLARQMFDEIPTGSLTISAKTAFMSACAAHGLAREAVDMFENEVTLQEADDMVVTAVLAACAREGLLHEGERVFQRVKKPAVHHYTCMVELYGKAGRVEEAERLIGEMDQEPDVVLCNALLSACRANGRVDVASRVANGSIGSTWS